MREASTYSWGKSTAHDRWSMSEVESDSDFQLDAGLRAQALLPLVYEQLRRLARQKLAREAPGHTIQATALVHEAYLRLARTKRPKENWDGRTQFFCAAAEAMRRILVEDVRHRRRKKRGGDRQREEFHSHLALAPEYSEDLVALDAALTKLAMTDPVAVELVKLRYFAGLTMSEAADSLGLAPRTAERMWSYARAWLHREVAAPAADDPES